MPYKSLAQARKFHHLLKEGKIKKSVVDEWDTASQGLDLPEKVGSPKRAITRKPFRRRKRALGRR